MGDHGKARRPADNLQTQQNGGLRTAADMTTMATVLQTKVELPDMARFAGPAVAVKDVIAAGQVQVEAPEGLALDADLSKLDEGLRKLQQQERDARLRDLLERAQRLIGQGKFRPAITALKKVLDVDAANAPAYLLQGHCHLELGEHEQALALLDKARQHARDPETLMLALMLRAMCQRAATKAMEARIVDLLESGQLVEAELLVVGALRAEPDNPVLLYYHCGILLLRKQYEAAKAVATRALSFVSAANANRFRELLGQIEFQLSLPYLESLRRCLREGDYAKALRLAADCPEVLKEHKQFLVVRAYAHDAAARSGRTSLMTRMRIRRGAVAPLAASALQDVLSWILGEELAAGCEALNREDYSSARRQFEAATAIDARSNILAFLHSIAIFRALAKQFQGSSPPDLDIADTQLRYAGGLAQQAAVDPTIRDQARRMAEQIEANLNELQSVRVRVERARAVSNCIEQFNTLTHRYQNNPIANRNELLAAVGALQSIQQSISAVRARYRLESDEAKVLNQLGEAVSKNLTALR